MNANVFSALSLLGVGFVLGLKHALDADHVAAVATLVSQEKNLTKSSLLGFFWGLGHTLVLLLAGAVMLSFKIMIPGKIALSFELIIGVILVFLGADALIRVYREKIHLHQHSHDGVLHMHFHSHNKSESHSHSHKSFFVGMLHGLAGSAALMLLIVGSVKSVYSGILFILVFGAGSILGMILISTLLGLPFLFSRSFEKVSFGVKAIAGVCSIILGAVIIYQIGIAQSLII